MSQTIPFGTGVKVAPTSAAHFGKSSRNICVYICIHTRPHLYTYLYIDSYIYIYMYICESINGLPKVGPEMPKVIGKVVTIYENISCILRGQLVGPTSACDDSTMALA